MTLTEETKSLLFPLENCMETICATRDIGASLRRNLNTLLKVIASLVSDRRIVGAPRFSALRFSALALMLGMCTPLELP